MCLIPCSISERGHTQLEERIMSSMKKGSLYRLQQSIKQLNQLNGKAYVLVLIDVIDRLPVSVLSSDEKIVLGAIVRMSLRDSDKTNYEYTRLDIDTLNESVGYVPRIDRVIARLVSKRFLSLKESEKSSREKWVS